jgi:hypothetical protein
MGTTPERRSLWERAVAAVAAADPAGISLWTLAAMSEDLGVTSVRPSEVSPRLGDTPEHGDVVAGR